MKKLLITLGAVLLLTSSVSAIDLIVDNNPLITDTPPALINGRTLVPLRSIFEELDADVNWNAQQQKITATKDDTIIELTLNQSTAYINGEATTLDVPPQSLNGRTMVPARFVSEALNAKVYWLPDTSTIRIASQLFDVVRVVDGDTVIVNYDGVDEYVRLIGINTPESVHPDEDKNTPEGIVASDYAKTLLNGKQVELEFDIEMRDKYDRLLAYVYVDGVMVNKTLLESGHATIYTFKPNTKYLDDFYDIVA